MPNELDQKQRLYYAQTASQYDEVHLSDDTEHNFALGVMIGLLGYLGTGSVLDVGSGTGRVLHALKRAAPGLKILGVEPVRELREVACRGGLPPAEIVEGDATKLDFPDGAFDLVCAFGVLHHIREQELAVSEMLRVARKAVFISDVNIYGQGSPSVRWIKQILRLLRLWPAAFFIKNRGRSYLESKEDGISYSYSVFDSLPLFRRHCQAVHVFGTRDSGPDLLRTASHAALLGIKRASGSP